MNASEDPRTSASQTPDEHKGAGNSHGAQTVAARLGELGLTLPMPPPPLAAYVPAVRVGQTIYTAGQLPMVDGTLAQSGVVGHGEGQISPEDAQQLAGICALNAIAAIKALGVDLDALRIAKVTGFVASDPSFTGQPGVINGASTLIASIFKDHGVHARSAVGVACLPLGSPVEVEVTAHVL